MRIGGRGCPSCGSHNTTGNFKQRKSWCEDCSTTWQPCTTTCRGYTLDVHHPDGPMIRGCKECGTPDRIARTWPEAYSSMFKVLTKKVDRLAPTLEQFPGQTRKKTSGQR